MPPKKVDKSPEDDLASCLINSEKFKHFIKSIMQQENAYLLDEVKTLKEEIVILRESNIQLINMLACSNFSTSSVNPQKPNCQMNKSKTAVAKVNSKTADAPENKNSNDTQEQKTLNDKILISNKNTHSINTLEKDEPNKRKFNKKKNTKVLTGTVLNDRSGGKLSGVDKKVFLHISKFKNEEADTSDLMEYIKGDVDINRVECEKLKTYFGNHTYFKLGIPHEFLNKFYQADYWPYGVEISNFLFRSNNNKIPPQVPSNTAS